MASNDASKDVLMPSDDDIDNLLPQLEYMAAEAVTFLEVIATMGDLLTIFDRIWNTVMRTKDTAHVCVVLPSIDEKNMFYHILHRRSFTITIQTNNHHAG